MTKPLLLFLTMILTLGSCKKDNENEPKGTSNQLEGNWTLRVEKLEYYDEANNKVHEETSIPNSTYAISEHSIRIFYPGFDKTGTYWISETSGQLNIIHYFMAQTRVYQVTSITNHNMAWVEERKNVTFHKDYRVHPAAKSITHYQLVKQP